MSTPNPPGTEKRSFRRYREGDAQWTSLRERIFQAGHSYKCPTYIQSTPPCQASCPAGEDIRSYLNIVRGIEKPPVGVTWQEYAWRRLTEANPFPAVMGRVCPSPCETGCNRNALEDHVGINSVEHFLGEYANRNDLRFPAPAVKTGKKVAVIGGGPAGLSCAYQLARKGHDVTIFETHAELGGMMRYGIPGFRTPREVLDAEIRRIVELGIEVRLNCRVGTDVTLEALRRDYGAVFLAMGAQSGRALPAPGADAPNVVTATAFLRAFNDGRLRYVGRRVVVVGGGDTSIDVATVARRLGHIADAKPTDFPEHAIAGRLAHDAAVVSAKQGSDVILTSVFTVDKMQASRHEVEQALAEGIEIRGGLAPVRVVRDDNGRATGLVVAPCKARFVSGRLQIEVLEGTEEVLPADLVVSAVGQAVDFTGLEAFDDGKGAVTTDGNYQVRGQAGVFAGGDVIRPHLLSNAIGHGAIAAEGIDGFLAGEDPEKRPKIDVHAFDLHRKMLERGVAFEAAGRPMRGTSDAPVGIHNYDDRSARYVIPHDKLFLGHFLPVPRNRRTVVTLSRDSALGNFTERLQPLDEPQAVAEAGRCMSCGQCFECDNCVVYCPQKAVHRVPKKEATTGRYVYTDYDRCIGCHICADVCPTGYIQMGLGE